MARLPAAGAGRIADPVIITTFPGSPALRRVASLWRGRPFPLPHLLWELILDLLCDKEDGFDVGFAVVVIPKNSFLLLQGKVLVPSVRFKVIPDTEDGVLLARQPSLEAILALGIAEIT